MDIFDNIIKDVHMQADCIYRFSFKKNQDISPFDIYI